MSDVDGEFVINTSIKEYPDGSVMLRVVQPRTIEQKVGFASLDAWYAFARAVEAFQDLVPKGEKP